MGYIEQNLNSSETIVQKAAIHWGVFVMPVILLVLGIVFANSDGLVSLIGWLILLVAVVKAFQAVALYLSTEMALTNQRVIGKYGVLRRFSIELSISKLETIKVDQSLIGRILNFGKVSVIGVGATKESFRFISNPVDFRNKVQNKMAEIS